MMVNTARAHARRFSAGCIALGHVGIVVLALTGRLVFIVPSGYRFLALISDNPIWVLVHCICAVVLVTSLVRDRGQISALSFSASIMGAWGFLNVLAGLTSPSPVSLAGPVLGMVLGATAWSVAMGWAVAPHRAGGSL